MRISEYNKIIEMAKNGHTYAQIARATGWSPQYVFDICVRECAMHSRFKHYSLSKGELQRLIRCIEAGFKTKDLAEMFGVCEATIRTIRREHRRRIAGEILE